jgi:hypothetical protein
MYEGEFHNYNVMQGHGKLRIEELGITYKGDFNRNTIDGEGTVTYDN